MKIVALGGSPRKGDSYRVCCLIAEIMNSYSQNETGAIEFGYLHLDSLRINTCLGCSRCFQEGDQYCPLQDDVTEVRQKMQEADGIIFVSPVYACHVTSTMKKTIDRLAYLFHRPELIGKPAMVVTTTDGGGLRETSKFLKMTATGWGCTVTGTVSIISSFFFETRKFNNYYNEKYKVGALKKIHRMSACFYEAIRSGKRGAPSFFELYLFNGLRSKAYSSAADYSYWKRRGWLTAEYYYPVRLGPGKRLFGAVLKGIIRMMWKKMSTGTREEEGKANDSALSPTIPY
jgi:multimeric flavodoxin WrbA